LRAGASGLSPPEQEPWNWYLTVMMGFVKKVGGPVNLAGVHLMGSGGV
jgi:hypothetical protein